MDGPLIYPARRFISAAAAKASSHAFEKAFAILRLHPAHRALDSRKRLR